MAKKDLRKIKEQKAALNKDELKKAATKANINVDEINDKDIKNYEDAINKYGNKSESELMGDLEMMIGEGRRDGTFSEDALDAFVKNVMPMMDENQREKLENITRMIKMNKI